jgi:hypothetical protein
MYAWMRRMVPKVRRVRESNGMVRVVSDVIGSEVSSYISR